MKKLILICALLPLIASCAFKAPDIKATDYGLSEEELNARKKQYDSICEGYEGRECDKVGDCWFACQGEVLTFRDFLNNYDTYNKYPVDVLQKALGASNLNAGYPYSDYTKRNESFWYYIQVFSEMRTRDERIAASNKYWAEQKAKREEETARILKKYNKAPGDVIKIPSSQFAVWRQTHDGTLVSAPYREGLSPDISWMVLFIVRNKSDSSLPPGSWIPGGIFEETGGLYEYISFDDTVKVATKYKRLGAFSPGL